MGRIRDEPEKAAIEIKNRRAENERILQLFGTKSIGWLVAVICAAIFYMPAIKDRIIFFRESDTGKRKRRKDQAGNGAGGKIPDLAPAEH